MKWVKLVDEYGEAHFFNLERLACIRLVKYDANFDDIASIKRTYKYRLEFRDPDEDGYAGFDRITVNEGEVNKLLKTIGIYESEG